jgi:hypothetical protein
VQASRASDTEILQSQVNKAAKKRLSLNGLEILHGRLISPGLPLVSRERESERERETEDREKSLILLRFLFFVFRFDQLGPVLPP